MSNVLPLEALRALKRRETSRMVFVGSLAALSLGLLVLLSLIPLFVAGADRGANSPEAKALQETGAERASIVRAQLLTRELSTIASSTSAVETVEAVVDARPPKIFISSINYIRGNPGTITVGGSAPSREEISAYRTTLAKDPRFKSVTVPLGILTGAEGGRFSITLSGTF
ncbi:hypothetical protein HY478_01560 [Candidatus Uhrbacteria bacterium]|nr:hypothetical protein [Candidatus Uhrbacteria bacterium]